MSKVNKKAQANPSKSAGNQPPLSKPSGNAFTQATASKVAKVRTPGKPIFEKENVKWLLIGLAVLGLGYIFMIGGQSPDPNVYDESQLFSFVRISLSPIMICVGFGIMMYGIMKGTPKQSIED